MAEINAALLILCTGLAWYDLRHRRVPNAVTLPLLAAGAWLHFPGSPWLWAACGLLLASWRLGWLGGGDAKLWMALLWWAPAGFGAALAMGVVFFLSGLAQLAWRRFRAGQLLGVRSPGVWRTIPFVLWAWMVG